MDSYDFDDRFGKLVSGSLEGLDTLELRRLATYVGMKEHTAATIDRLDEEQYAVLQRSLVGLAAGAAEAVAADYEERGRYALRLLMNVGQRSGRHNGSLPVDVLPQLRDLLLARRHVPECAAVLTMAGPRLSTTAALDHNLDTIVATVAHLWLSVEDDATRCWLSAFVARMLEADGAFLANAFGELPSTAFTALLHVVEALCDGLVMGGRRDDEFRMAKSLRSKFKRKMRTIKREKNAPKTDKMLATVVAKMAEHEAKQDAVMGEEPTKAEEKMETGEKSSLNLKTMKKADGSYPSWMSAKKKRELAKSARAEKSKKKQVAAKKKRH